jgi:hypothetical protein
MIDLTKITTPFGLLDKETQSALREYDGTIEWFNGSIWVCNGHTFFYNSSTYRAKPLKLPEWPAGLLPKWRWMAMDESGRVVVYERRPIVDAYMCMWVKGGLCTNVSCLFEALNFDGIPWRESLIQRPEGV